MRNFKLAAARIIGVLALALGYYAYHLHNKKNMTITPPCFPGYVLHDDNKENIESCIKNTK